MERRNTTFNRILFPVLILLSALFLAPVLIVLMNSFKGRFYISETAFLPPTGEMFVGLQNYISGVEKTAFFKAFGYSLYITIFSGYTFRSSGVVLGVRRRPFRVYVQRIY
jgi:raffinose/stachyose/melibiose transport system permease protein